MVKRIFFILALLLPHFAIASNFTATIDRNNIALGENLTLKLTLSDASSDGAPNISALQKDFRILNQRQSSSTRIINGDVSSSSSWIYNISPKNKNVKLIPSIKVKTNKGVLATDKITISVKPASSLSSSTQDSSIKVKALLNKYHPYKNEPIIYTAKLVTTIDVTNVTLGELEMENAIIEKNGDIMIYDEIQNGIQTKVIEVSYIITPLVFGNYTIPSIIIRGDKLTKHRSNFDSMFDDNFASPFGMIGRSMGFSNLQPFTLSTKEISIDVKKPVSSVSPWLAAESIELSEDFDETQLLKAGEPILRNITIVAKGVLSSQLPDLNLIQNTSNNYKIYADQPLMENNINGDLITSWRQENYTIIPQKEGQIILPEISIAWWNVNTEEISYATIPARTLDIKANSVAKNNLLPKPAPDNSAKIKPKISEGEGKNKHLKVQRKNSNNNLYYVITFLVLVLIIILLWALKLKAQIYKSAKSQNSQEKISNNKPDISINKLSSVTNAKELHNFLQIYAQKYWGNKPNDSLDNIFNSAKKIYQASEAANLDNVNRFLQDSLYANKDIDINQVKNLLLEILKHRQYNTRIKTNNKNKNFVKLNP